MVTNELLRWLITALGCAILLGFAALILELILSPLPGEDETSDDVNAEHCQDVYW